MSIILLLLVSIIPPARKDYIEVHSVLVNTVYDHTDGVRLKQLVFMDEKGYSLGFYLINGSEDYKLFKQDKIVFLRRSKNQVRFKLWLNEKKTREDYETRIRKNNIRRLLP